MSIFGSSPSSDLQTLNLSLHLCNPIGWSISFESFHSYECLSSYDWFLVQSSSKNVMSLIMSVLPSQFSVVLIGSKIFYPKSTISNPIHPVPPIVPMSVMLFWSLDIFLFLFLFINGGPIIALLREVYSCWIQHIIQELDRETIWYLGTCMPQW